MTEKHYPQNCWIRRIVLDDDEDARLIGQPREKHKRRKFHLRPGNKMHLGGCDSN